MRGKEEIISRIRKLHYENDEQHKLFCNDCIEEAIKQGYLSALNELECLLQNLKLNQ